MILKNIRRCIGRVLLTIAGISIGIAVAQFLAKDPSRSLVDEPAASPYLEDLWTFRSSGLGQSLLAGEIPPEIVGIGLEGILPEMRMFLRSSMIVDGEESDGQEMGFLGFRWA
jgi:hypothetical protein